MKMKLFLVSIMAVSQIFCAEVVADSGLQKNSIAASCEFRGPQQEKCIVQSLFDSDNTQKRVEEHIRSLSAMLSNPAVMNLYLSGASYPRNTLLEIKIGLAILLSDPELLKGDDISEKLKDFLKGKKENDVMELALDDIPLELQLFYQSKNDANFVRLVLCHLSDDSISNMKTSLKGAADGDDEVQVLEERLKYKTLITRLMQSSGYELPQKIANHVNLDLKTDGLPRFIIQAADQTVGLMRFGAYPKSSIDQDLAENHKALALLNETYLQGRGCAIAAVMLQEQYQGKGYGSAFWMEMFAKILPCYATNPEAPKYPEGQLGQIYVTHRAEQVATAKLVGKLKDDPRFNTVNLGDFMSGTQKKMAYLIQFVEVTKTETEPAE